MLKVGITGGIGSGKTTACQIFEQMGIPVYNADQRAKALMTSDPELIAAIKRQFGNKAYLENGQLNRPFIATIVFSDKSQLQALNALVHPAVLRDGLRWHNNQQGVPYTLKEAALLFESGSYLNLDKVITVFAPKALRLQRVAQRDGVSEAEVEARMKEQMPEEEKQQKADYIIYNDQQQALIPQIWAIHQKLSQLSQSPYPQ